MATAATTRDLIIALPASTTEELEALARYLDRDLNWLVLNSIQTYIREWKESREELEAPINPSSPDSVSLAEVSTMIKQARHSKGASKAA